MGLHQAVAGSARRPRALWLSQARGEHRSTPLRGHLLPARSPTSGPGWVCRSSKPGASQKRCEPWALLLWTHAPNTPPASPGLGLRLPGCTWRTVGGFAWRPLVAPSPPWPRLGREPLPSRPDRLQRPETTALRPPAGHSQGTWGPPPTPATLSSVPEVGSLASLQSSCKTFSTPDEEAGWVTSLVTHCTPPPQAWSCPPRQPAWPSPQGCGSHGSRAAQDGEQGWEAAGPVGSLVPDAPPIPDRWPPANHTATWVTAPPPPTITPAPQLTRATRLRPCRGPHTHADRRLSPGAASRGVGRWTLWSPGRTPRSLCSARGARSCLTTEDHGLCSLDA